ncbi:hypothetical protein GCM10027277_05020 [Pseudoduganella ginsengisoli]|uniref:Efflux RND transporter periplasmic adaptor subunit n=1 Tax=Pseudoduganella ginsengisoli TaxID=1462440 RepID=A0A6L6Q4Y1_9BURK|nr:efflux RND transporter periplasmic adaptor subunit [Pseudoduganella ginsengisoli]MTW04202.1 efflux RND transporter periplasmic adaptor subunit [Pseudoduganella ginsengisoli]
MKLTFDKQSLKAVLGISVAGAVLAAIILASDGNQAAKPIVQPNAEHSLYEDDVIAMSDEQIRSAGIVMANAQAATIGALLRLPGEVKFNEDRTAHVVPRLPGVAESVHADLGQHVKKGQVLAVIASPELSDLRSQLLAADKRLALAKATYEREKKLWQDRISAEQDYLQARLAFNEAEIHAQTARAKLTALGAEAANGALNRYVLRAPFDGVVVEKHIAQGEAVKEDANVFLLSDLSSVWVEINVTAADIEALRVGGTVDIQSGSTSSSTSGKVSYVGNLLGEQTRTAKARVVIDNPHKAWRPGLFVNAAVAKGQKEVAVAVESGAVQTLDGQSVVFTRVAKGFKATTVRTGLADGRLVEIADGLPPGAAYAATGSFVVKAQQGKGNAGHEH